MRPLALWGGARSATPPPSVALAIDEERVHVARRVAGLRAVAVSAYAAFAIVFGALLRLDPSGGAYRVTTVYAVVAVGVYAGVRRSRRFAVASGIFLALLDVAAVHGLQLGIMRVVPDAATVVALNLATMCVIVMVASMWMRTSMTVAAALAAAVSQSLLFAAIGKPSAVASVLLILGLAGAACIFVSKRVRRLLVSTNELVIAQGAAEREVARIAAEQSRSFRDLVDALPDGALVASAGSVRYANSKLVELVSGSTGDLVGRPVCGLVVHDEEEALAAHFAAATGDTALPIELHLLRADGRRVPIEVSSANLVTGGATSTISVIRDITERTIVRDQLLLADRMVSMGTLAATIAHDINNPVSVVQANLEYVADGLALDPVVTADMLSAIADSREAILNVGAIVRQLKVLSRLEDDAPIALDVRGVIESSARMAQSQIWSRAHLSLELASILHVRAVPSRLGQVMLNLLVNAAQAFPNAAPRTNAIVVRTFDEGDRVVIEVEDNGAGMKPDVVARIFEPFFTTKPLGIGTGLGLPVCERIIHAMGGSIVVTSTPDVGSTFRVSLPGLPVETHAPAEPVAAGTFVSSRVLAIDDDPAVLSIIARALGARCQLSGLSSAAEATALIASGARFDAVLCDLTMPGMSGAAFHRELARVAPEQASRMAIVSGGAVDPLDQSYVDEQGLPFLRKPFTGQELRALIEKLSSVRTPVAA